MTNWTWEGIAHPAPVDAESIVKVSGRFLVPSTAAGFQLVTRSNEKFAARFFMGQDNMVHLDVNDLTDVVEPVDPDAWFDFSITIDLDAQVDAVQEIVFGSDRIDNPGIFLYNIDQHQFDSIALLATGDWSIPDNQQGIRFDDISVEIIPEPGTVLLLLSCMLFGLRRRF